MNDYILELNNVKKYYRRNLILNNVTLKIPKGCIYGIVGPNGAGKTTILKTMCGLTKISFGEVIAFGEKFSIKHLRRIGALIESPPVYNNLTARENLLIHALIMRLKDEEIKRVLEIVGLDYQSRKLVSQYSLGMKQRLGIAIALLGDPEILILDEPTNGLDPIGIQEMRELIKSFKKSGKTVIISSHILSEIEQIIDYVSVIVSGEVKYSGEFKDDRKLEEIFFSILQGRNLM